MPSVEFTACVGCREMVDYVVGDTNKTVSCAGCGARFNRLTREVEET